MPIRNLCLAILLAALLTPRAATAQFGPTKVVTARAAMKELPQTIALVGTVQPITRSTLGTEVAGLVVKMPARQGDFIAQDDLLCQLNDDVLTFELEREQARLANLQAQLEELENGTRKEELARLKAELDAATAIAQRWQYELERVKKLQGSEYANEKEYQDALAEKLASESRLRAARASYEQAVAGPRREVIAQARFAVAQQQAEVSRIESDLAKTRIRAPFSGFVTNRFAEVGNWLSIGDPVVELVDLSSVLIRVDAPEKAFPYATVGAEITVYIDALKESFDGVIRHVIPQADEAARTFPVEIELANPDGALKAGMFARATVPAGPNQPMLAVPKDALIDAPGGIKIALVIPGEQGMMAMPTFVSLGADAGEWVAITSGNVPPDAKVAVYGNEQLVFPQPVEVAQSRAEVDQQQTDGAAAAPSAQ